MCANCARALLFLRVRQSIGVVWGGTRGYRMRGRPASDAAARGIILARPSSRLACLRLLCTTAFPLIATRVGARVRVCEGGDARVHYTNLSCVVVSLAALSTAAGGAPGGRGSMMKGN